MMSCGKKKIKYSNEHNLNELDRLDFRYRVRTCPQVTRLGQRSTEEFFSHFGTAVLQSFVIVSLYMTSCINYSVF